MSALRGYPSLRPMLALVPPALAVPIPVAPIPAAPIRLAPILGDGAVLQKGKPLADLRHRRARQACEGHARRGRPRRATSGATGPGRSGSRRSPAGGPYTLVAATTGSRAVSRDVLVGEVWLAGGQSNMEWPLALTDDRAFTERRLDPRVRIFRVRHVSSEAPEREVQGDWAKTTEPGADKASAIGIAFGIALRRRLAVPVGIVQATWGGSRVESWISARMLEGDPATRPIADGYVASQYDFDDRMATYKESMDAWTRESRRSDPGISGALADWVGPDAHADEWPVTTLPATLSDALGREAGTQSFAGAVWFRRSVELPASWVGAPLRLDLGAYGERRDLLQLVAARGRDGAQGASLLRRQGPAPGGRERDRGAALRRLGGGRDRRPYAPAREPRDEGHPRSRGRVAREGRGGAPAARRGLASGAPARPRTPQRGLGRVQRDDRPALGLCHARDDLLPGRGERRRVAALPRPLPRAHPRVAPARARRAPPVPLRPAPGLRHPGGPGRAGASGRSCARRRPRR